MTTVIKSYPMYFNRIKFASEVRHVMEAEQYTVEDVAAFTGLGIPTISKVRSGDNWNIEMRTFLGVCNALHLNPINYFDLAEL